MSQPLQGCPAHISMAMIHASRRSARFGSAIGSPARAQRWRFLRNLAIEEIRLQNDGGPTGSATKSNFSGADGAGDVAAGNYRRASILATAVALTPPASKRYPAGLSGLNDVPRLNRLTRMGAME